MELSLVDRGDTEEQTDTKSGGVPKNNGPPKYASAV